MSRGIDASRGPHFSDASLSLEAALEGMGVALAMKPLVRSEIEAGRLVVPFDITAPASYSYYLVTPESAREAGTVSDFRELAARRGRARARVKRIGRGPLEPADLAEAPVEQRRRLRT